MEPIGYYMTFKEIYIMDIKTAMDKFNESVTAFKGIMEQRMGSGELYMSDEDAKLMDVAMDVYNASLALAQEQANAMIRIEDKLDRLLEK
jgi:hypothetical protein